MSYKKMHEKHICMKPGMKTCFGVIKGDYLPTSHRRYTNKHRYESTKADKGRKIYAYRCIPRKADFCSLSTVCPLSVSFRFPMQSRAVHYQQKASRQEVTRWDARRITNTRTNAVRPELIACVLARSCRSVFAILWWGRLLSDPPVSQQQRPVLVCGSLWQRGGWLTHSWSCRLR